jgi:cold shock CspA family protein
MPTTDEEHTTGTVEWFDAERGVGAIRPDDGAAPCAVGSATLRDCGIASLAAGDRVRFRVQGEGDERTATDLTLLRAVQRWENEGGAVRPEAPEA